MAKSFKRSRQVSDVIKHQLATLLKKEVSDPRLKFVAISGVEVSVDLRNAKIFFTLLNDKVELQETMDAFNKANGFLRCLVAEGTALRHVPKLHFIFDESIGNGARISELIQGVITPEDFDAKNSDEA
jgi:ribosome-binding factor A